MSKADVRKYVKSLDKDSLVELVMELYSARKEVKEILEYKISPDEDSKLEDYKEIILKEFFPMRGYGQLRFSVCKKAIKEFRQLNPSPAAVADLMLYFVECATEYSSEVGDLWEAYYDSTCINFGVAMKFIGSLGFQAEFEPRIQKILQECEDTGWGFPEIMWQVYEEYNSL